MTHVVELLANEKLDDVPLVGIHREVIRNLVQLFRLVVVSERIQVNFLIVLIDLYVEGEVGNCVDEPVEEAEPDVADLVLADELERPVCVERKLELRELGRPVQQNGVFVQVNVLLESGNPRRPVDTALAV